MLKNVSTAHCWLLCQNRKEAAVQGGWDVSQMFQKFVNQDLLSAAQIPFQIFAGLKGCDVLRCERSDMNTNIGPRPPLMLIDSVNYRWQTISSQLLKLHRAAAPGWTAGPGGARETEATGVTGRSDGQLSLSLSDFFLLTHSVICFNAGNVSWILLSVT